MLSNILPFEQVAHFRAKWSVVDVGTFAPLLGYYYNSAMIVCETNFPGNAVQDALILNSRYPLNYQAESHINEDPKIKKEFGFKTTQASKWLLIRQMQQALVELGIIINCPLTVEEMGNFVYVEDKTRTGAAAGFNDDSVMGLMLAYHGALTYPQMQKNISERKVVYTDPEPQNRNILKRFHEMILEKKDKKKDRIIL